MSKYREQKRADTLQEIIECLGEARKSDYGVWVGKNYSLGQLKEDIKSIAETAESKFGMHEGAWNELYKQQQSLGYEFSKALNDNFSSLIED